MNDVVQKYRKNHGSRIWNLRQIAATTAWLITLFAIAAFIMWFECRYLSPENPKQPTEYSCPVTSSCEV
jgi:hypothetical protein